jgi:hypothetical protein
MRIALGFRAHSGWAAMVAVGGSAGEPHVVDRRRVVIADPELAGSKQPYHAAAELPFPRAKNAVQRVIHSSRGLALEAIEAALAGLGAKQHEVAACGVVLASGKPLPELGKILASHALIHTAEGELFRDVLVWAAKERGLKVAGVREKDINLASLPGIDSLGRLVGPPWTLDQKYATAVALHALGGL